jgi:hypothetical protein
MTVSSAPEGTILGVKQVLGMYSACAAAMHKEFNFNSTRTLSFGPQKARAPDCTEALRQYRVHPPHGTVTFNLSQQH